MPRAERPTSIRSAWEHMARAIPVDGSATLEWYSVSVPHSHGQLSPELIQVFAKEWTKRVAIPGDAPSHLDLKGLAYLLDILRRELLTDSASAAALGDLRRACFNSTVVHYRRLAIDLLPRVPDEQSKLALRAALEAPDSDRAQRAAQRLQPVGQPFPADLFTTLLGNSSPDVRHYAIQTVAPLTGTVSSRALNFPRAAQPPPSCNRRRRGTRARSACSPSVPSAPWARRKPCPS